MDTMNRETETDDFGTAAYLLTKGYPIMGAHLNGRRVVFTFRGELSEEVKAFSTGIGDEVSASRFDRMTRQVRNLINSVREDA